MKAYYATQFDALGDPMRRVIVERLLARPQPVGVLARALPISRPAVSQHLRVLKAAHLVTDRAEGTRRIYAIDPQGFAALRDYLDRFWTDALAAFKQEAESSKSRRTP